MNQKEILDFKNLPRLPFLIDSCVIYEDKLVVNGKIAIAVEGYASYYEISKDISILNPDGKEIGLLCFTKELGTITLNELTENQFIAYLIESPYQDNEELLPYNFLKNYIVINIDDYEDYLNNYFETSALWGGFLHESSVISTISVKKKVEEIKMLNLNLVSPIYKENIIRAILQPFAFERYLKLYHLLELRFDLDIVKKIQVIDLETELDKIGGILNDFTSNTKELARLRDILNTNCNEYLNLIPLINRVNLFPKIAFDIFFKFGSGKESNPLKNHEGVFYDLIVDGFEEKILKNSIHNLGTGHRTFVLNLVSYWIYRVRCCIAHNKIGEYILTKREENFLVDFAEPLLVEVVQQCFKR